MPFQSLDSVWVLYISIYIYMIGDCIIKLFYVWILGELSISVLVNIYVYIHIYIYICNGKRIYLQCPCRDCLQMVVSSFPNAGPESARPWLSHSPPRHM